MFDENTELSPPKPVARLGNLSLLGYFRLFKKDFLSAQPARLYRAWMAEMRTPFFRSYLCNDPTFEGGRIRTVFPAMWDSGMVLTKILKRGIGNLVLD